MSLSISSSSFEAPVCPGIRTVAVFADTPTGSGTESVGHAEMVVVDRSVMSDDAMVRAVSGIQGDGGYLAEAALEISGRTRHLALVESVYIYPEWRGHDLGRQMFSLLAAQAGTSETVMIYLPWPMDADISDSDRVFEAADRLERLWATLGSKAVPGLSGCWWTTPAQVESARAGVR